MKKEELKTLYEKAKLKATDTFDEPPVCLSVIDQFNKSIVCTLGGISMVQGAKKARKTFYISSVAATLLKNNGSHLNFTPSLPENKRTLLYVDTEQEKYRSNKVLKRITKIIGLGEDQHPSNLEYVNLRQYPPEIRTDIIDYAISKIPNLGFVLIDGIRDCLYSPNDETQSIQIVSKLMKWSLEKEIHIMSVLHQNKGDHNARGHLGTELSNKAESIIIISKDTNDKSVSLIKSDLRDINFKDIAFSIDEDGIPFVIENFKSSEEIPTKRKDPTNLEDQTHINLLDEIYINGEQFTQNKLVERIKATAKRYDIEVGGNKAREWIKYYLEKEFLKNAGSEKEFILRRS